MIILYSMETNNTIEEKNINPFPFSNLFLLKGYVTGKNEFWQYLLGIVAAFLGYLSFQLIMMIPLLSAAMSHGITMNEIAENPNILFNPEKIGINKSLLLALMMGMFVFSLLFLWLAIKFIQKKSLTSIITGYENIRWKRYFFSFGVWGILIIILTIASYLISPQEIEVRFNAGPFFILLIVSVLLIPIQTATEELIFRGYLMQGFGLAFKNGIAPLIITSVLFGLMHAQNPEAQAHGLLIMMPYYIFFGAFLGVLTLLDEGSELAMGIHCANNLFSSLLVCSKNSVLQTDAIFYSTSENPGGEFIVWVIMAAICFFILFKKYKLSNWKLIIR
ncbi:MAG: CPBP family intramembrane metalloprotease domain-containing protein [Sphingobacteriaceae bacterium]|nr:CPBP family intramembrane metalloprotease domain-containing protein [Sphingobacteriaceae bacterium]